MSNYIHSHITEDIIGAAWSVFTYYKGSGYFEEVYEKALMYELQAVGYKVERQVRIEIFYKNGKLIGHFFADLVVDDLIILELKAKENLHPADMMQLTHYLKATKMELGLLLNFGNFDKLQIKRRVLTNDKK